MSDRFKTISDETASIVGDLCEYISMHTKDKIGQKEENILTVAKYIVCFHSDWLVSNSIGGDERVPFSYLAFSMRLLLESVADLDFISRNQDTAIDDFLSQLDILGLEGIYERAKTLDFKNETKYYGSYSTVDRVKNTFGEEGIKRYNFYCLYSHFNNLGSLSSFAIDSSYPEHRKRIIKFLPVIIDKFISALNRFEALNGIEKEFSEKITHMYQSYLHMFGDKDEATEL